MNCVHYLYTYFPRIYKYYANFYIFHQETSGMVYNLQKIMMSNYCSSRLYRKPEICFVCPSRQVSFRVVIYKESGAKGAALTYPVLAHWLTYYNATCLWSICFTWPSHLDACGSKQRPAVGVRLSNVLHCTKCCLGSLYLIIIRGSSGEVRRDFAAGVFMSGCRKVVY